jgi:peptidyl-prolyl cis-trans isomerase A (cyclophilin A)
MIKSNIGFLYVVLLLIGFTSCKEQYPDLEDGLYAEFVTSKDTMVAILFYKKAPVTVANFVALAEGIHPLVSDEYKNKKYYNGTTFHRVMDGFMIQGGDPTATGSGNPGYKFEDEFSPDLKHSKPGMLSMANSGPNTNGSQFFITEVENSFPRCLSGRRITEKMWCLSRRWLPCSFWRTRTWAQCSGFYFKCRSHPGK